MTLETQVNAIESANMNLETMTAMRRGADALRNIHGSLCVKGTVPSNTRILLTLPPSPTGTLTESTQPWTRFVSRWTSQTRSLTQSPTPSAWATTLTRCVLTARRARGRRVELTWVSCRQDELKDELEELEQAELNERLVGAEHVPVHTPAVAGPSRVNGEATRPQTVDDDDAELRALQAELAM